MIRLKIFKTTFAVDDLWWCFGFWKFSLWKLNSWRCENATKSCNCICQCVKEWHHLIKSREKWFQLSFNFSRKMMVALARKRCVLFCTSSVMLKSLRGRFVMRQNTDGLAHNLFLTVKMTCVGHWTLCDSQTHYKHCTSLALQASWVNLL